MSVSAQDLQALVTAIVQPMMSQMSTQMSQIMTQMTTELKTTNEKKGRIDHRSIGGPPEWDSSKEENFQE